jgi:predicted transposase/invertase (TIGR01784 family)
MSMSRAVSPPLPRGSAGREYAALVQRWRRTFPDAAATLSQLGAKLAPVARHAYGGAMSSSAHDALFKAVFGQPEHARGALRSVVPPAIADALDWPSLTAGPSSFIDEALGARHADLLFSVAWRDGGEALVYLLFEHQSTSDDRMAFRLLRYLVRIWERWLAEHPRAETLPVIVPVVLYHGDQVWSAPLTFDALFDIPAAVRPALAPHLVQFTYLLDDLSEIPDDQLRARAMMTALGRLVEICFKHARTRADLPEILAGWADVLHEVIHAPDGLEALVLVMRYILLVNDHVEPATLQAFLERVAGPDTKETIMTAGERLIQQGEERGIQKGEERGIQKGQRALLLHQLRTRFRSDVSADMEQRVANASSDQIALWAERVLSATTLAELLAD